MITVEEARDRMMNQVRALGKEYTHLVSAGHRYTLEDVVAPCDHPLFDMSAVDGYAFRWAADVTKWYVVGEVAAGHVLTEGLALGECVRIFTGAALPVGADTVVMQEHVQRISETITHSDQRLVQGANVRRRGEQLREGELIFTRGSDLTPEAIGLLATFGMDGVVVSERPNVALLITGDEFQKPGTLIQGRIYSSNDRMLAAALERVDSNWWVRPCNDDHAKLTEAIQDAASSGDLIISTGGASVGDHDLIEPVLRSLGATIHFHGVAQKPGKPMLFATLNGVPFFGLPGNPRAVMVLFYEYVLPFLRAMQGAREPWPRNEQLPIAEALTVKGDRAEFRAVQVRGGCVHFLRDEGSHMLRSLVDADAMAYLPAERRSWQVGDPVEVHYLPR